MVLNLKASLRYPDSIQNQLPLNFYFEKCQYIRHFKLLFAIKLFIHVLSHRLSLQLQQAGRESYKWRWPERPSAHKTVWKQPSRQTSIIPLSSITCAMNAGEVLKLQSVRGTGQPLQSIYLRCLQVASFILKARAVLVWSAWPHILLLNHVLFHYSNSRSSFCSVLWQSYICSISNPLEYFTMHSMSNKSCQTALRYFPFLSYKLLPSF